MAVVILDVLSTLLNTILLSSVQNKNRGNGTLAVLGIVLFISCVILAVASIVNACSKNSYKTFAKDLVISFAAVVYLIGDNLPDILESDGEDVGCDAQCVQRAQAAGKTLLIFSLVCFRLVPFIFRQTTKDDKNDDNDDRKAAWYSLHMLSLMVEFDAIYTAVWNEVYMSNGVCDDENHIGTWFSWVILWGTWIAFLFFYLWASSTNIKKFWNESKCYCCWFMAALVSAFLVAGSYILGDNNEPIGCICNNLSESCSEVSGNIIRAVLLGISLFLICIILVCSCFLYRKEKE